MKKNKVIFTFLIGTCLFTLTSCGGGGSSSHSGSKVSRQEQKQDDQGIYRAVLKPINSAVSGNTSGTVQIKIAGDDVTVTSNVTGAPAGVKHLQNLTLLSACPTSGNDANQDSFVDIAEAGITNGAILIPLDSNLSDQLSGMAFGPIANSEGIYVYKRSASLTELLSDLRSDDPDSTDAVVKLTADKDLNLAGKVIVIHGVASSSNLPDTVATSGDLSAEQSLPIACGELVRVTSEDTTAAETSVDSRN